ncbi:pentatricopeptide repeat protein, partial [Aspergillus sclerotialis]
MDTLWRVAGSMPEQGQGAPDRFTYTIIVKAITDASLRDVSKMDPNDLDKIHERKVQAIKEAKS